MDAYKFEEAKNELEYTKNELKEYLSNCYYNESSESANKTFKYLEKIVEKIIKRQKISISFGEGGSPEWYGNVFNLFSKWIMLELNICKMLSKNLETNY